MSCLSQLREGQIGLSISAIGTNGRSSSQFVTIGKLHLIIYTQGSYNSLVLNRESHHLQAMRDNILGDKHLGFCTYSNPGLLSCTFLGAPFLKKGPLKLQKGAQWALIGQFLE